MGEEGIKKGQTNSDVCYGRPLTGEPAPFLDLLSYGSMPVGTEYQFANSGNVAEQIIQPTHE